MKKMPMQLWILIWLWIGVAAGLQATETGYKGFPRGHVLIDAQELKGLMEAQQAWDSAVAEGRSPSDKNPKLVIVAVAKPKLQYRLKGHIPGALNIWRPDYESPEKLFGVRGENLMSRADFQAFLRSLGIDQDSTVVWYDHKYDATRLWWASKHYGFDTRVLDGGIQAWKAAGYEVARVSAPDKPEAGDVVLTGGIGSFLVGPEAVWRTKEHDGWRLWDVRNQAEYTGKKKRSKRAGYIPWQDDLVVWKEFHRPDKSWKDAEEVRAVLKRHGIKQGDHHVFYCQSGVRTTQMLMTLYMMGFPEETLHNFDGSWIYWGNSPDLPIATATQ